MVDYFERHKKYIREERNLFTLVLIVGFVVFALFLVAAVKNTNDIWLILMPMAMIIFALVHVISLTRLLKQFSNVDTKNISEIKILNPKVKFLTRMKVRRFSRLISPRYSGIKLIGEQKFYYLYGELYEYTMEDIQKIQAKFKGEISIQYYEGTTIIKTIENDPYFLKIKRSLD